MKKSNIAIIGAGYWGKNLIRVFYSLGEGVNLKYVCDLDDKKLQHIKSWYPSINTTSDVEIIFNDPEIDAVIIATQVGAHFTLAKRALLSGKNVLVEKPMTETSSQSSELIELAHEKQLVLMVDHTFLYTSAVRKIKQLADSGELGDIHYLDSERVNLGLIQPDINVVYDLAVHDLSIFNYVLGKEPKSVSAFGGCYFKEQEGRSFEDMAHIILNYPENINAHIHISWLSPVKIRKMLIGGSKKMVLYDDVDPSEKIKVYDKGIYIDPESITPHAPLYRSGDVFIPKLDDSEALKTEAEHFIRCVNGLEVPLTCGKGGLGVVKLLEACNLSIKEGREINL